MKNSKKLIAVVLAVMTVLSVMSTAIYSMAADDEAQTNDLYDFSEYNLASSFLIDAPYGSYENALDRGGNSINAAAYFARWDGPVNETTDPYPEDYEPESCTYTQYPHLLAIKDMNIYSNNLNEIKTAIMKYGAISVGFVFTDASEHPNYHTSLSDSMAAIDDETVSSHAVTMVGWDDNYSRNNFANKPLTDGAIICKNSWGYNEDDDGYIYISYCDAIFSKIRLSSDFSSFVAYDKTPDYNKIYQYDEYGMATVLGHTGERYDKINYIVNAFPEEGSALKTDEILKAISFYTTDSKTKYEAYLIPDFETKEDADISKDGVRLISSGTIDFAGYHVIELDEDILLDKGKRFGIAVKYDNGLTANSTYPIEVPISKKDNARSCRGESFYATDDMIIDLYDDIENGNWCVKAFTKEADSKSTGNISSNGFILNPVSGINRSIKDYISDKTYSVYELIEKGCEFSEEYIDYITNPSNISNGLIPSPVKFNTVQTLFGDKLPKKYDLRDYGRVTSVKNQGRFGTCWAFASIASLESNIITQYGEDGIFENVPSINNPESQSITISQKNETTVVKYTAEESGNHKITLTGGAFRTEIISAFGIVHETTRLSEINFELKKNETVYLRIGFADSDKTGTITFATDYEPIIVIPENMIEVNTDDSISGNIAAGETVTLRILNEAGYDGYWGFFRISSNSPIDISDEYNSYELEEYNGFYLWNGRPEDFYLTNPGSGNAEFTVETISSNDYFINNSVDIGSSREYSVTDGNVPVSLKFTPSETGYYTLVDKNGIYASVANAYGNIINSDEDKYEFYYMREDKTYYWLTRFSKSDEYYIVNWEDEHSGVYELTENKSHYDTVRFNDTAEYSFTAPSDGRYLIQTTERNEYCEVSFEITNNSDEMLIGKQMDFYSKKFLITDLSEGDIINIAVTPDDSQIPEEEFKENEEYYSKLRFPFGINIKNISVSDGGNSIAEIKENNVYDITYDTVESIYKFTPEKSGYYGLRKIIEDDYSPEIYFDENGSNIFNYIYHADSDDYSAITWLEKGVEFYFIIDYRYTPDDSECKIRFDYYGENETDFSPEKLTLDTEVIAYNFKEDLTTIEIPVELAPAEEGKTYPAVITVKSDYNGILNFTFAEDNIIITDIKKEYKNYSNIYEIRLPQNVTSEGFSNTLQILVNESCEMSIIAEDYSSYDKEFYLWYDENELSLETLKAMLLDMIMEDMPELGFFYNTETCAYMQELSLPLYIGTGIPYDQDDIIWTSTNEEVATVDENGNIKCVGLGSTRIIAETPDGEYSVSKTIYVKYSWWQLILHVLTFGQIWK